jgi:hypothetical protein
MANLTLRQVKGSPLTIAEMDGNFEYFTGSYTNTGIITAQGFSGSFTGSFSGTVTSASYAATASYVVTSQTASYVAAANVNGTVANATNAITASFVSSLLTIAPSDPLPTQTDGAIAFSSSGDFYFGSGSAWNKLNL